METKLNRSQSAIASVNTFAMLAHCSGSEAERAYNRAEHMGRRREPAQAWADLLLDGLPSANALMDGPKR